MKKLLLILMVMCFTNLKAQCDNDVPVFYDFQTNNLSCWTLIDADGDGNNWYWWQYSDFYGGYKCIVSNSFYTCCGPLTPDNWIYSNPISLTGNEFVLTWKLRGELTNFAHEYYSVYVSTGNTIASFKSSPVQVSEYVDEVGANGVWVTRSLDISELAGETVYIAFRHYNSTNQYNINIDDVSISGTLGVKDFVFNEKDAKEIRYYDLLGRRIERQKGITIFEYVFDGFVVRKLKVIK